MRRYYDLSHTITNGLITYKGLPAPLICDFYSREESRKNYDGGEEFQMGKIEMAANTGTYIDCPFHRFADGKDLSQVNIDKFVDLNTVVFRADVEQIGLEVGADLFKTHRDLRGKTILINTNWSKHWSTDTYYENHPFLSTPAAEYLVEQGVALVGIDTYNIDDTRTRFRPIHTILLKNEILIVEHLRGLESLPDHVPLLFNALPPKISGLGTFPVRAYAVSAS